MTVRSPNDEPRWAAEPPITTTAPPMANSAPPAAPATADDPPAQAPRADNRVPALLALIGAGLVVIGVSLVWVRIDIGGFSPPGSAQSGLEGGDGRTVVAGAAVSAIAALLALLGRRDLWIKIGLLITGSTMGIIAIVNMIRTGNKAADIKERFGIPPGEVHATIGPGLWVVVVGAILVVGAGLRLRTSR